MKLREPADVLQFLAAIRQCRKDVYFCTKRGDKLNLKSELTRFVMLSQIGNHEFLYESTVELADSADTALLSPFMAD